jgi:hypothetical protein
MFYRAGRHSGKCFANGMHPRAARRGIVGGTIPAPAFPWGKRERGIKFLAVTMGLRPTNSDENWRESRSIQ